MCWHLSAFFEMSSKKIGIRNEKNEIFLFSTRCHRFASGSKSKKSVHFKEKKNQVNKLGNFQ